MKEKHIRGLTARESSTSLEKHGNNKGAYTDGSKNTGRKVGFAAVFTNITRRGALLEEVSIHTAEMTAIKTGMK